MSYLFGYTHVLGVVDACVSGGRYFDVFHALVRYLVAKRVTRWKILAISNKPTVSRGNHRI